MPLLSGYSGGIAPQVIQTAPQPQAPPAGAVGRMDASTTQVIDGTPVRIVVLALSAAAGLFALKAAGLKFSIGASA